MSEITHKEQPPSKLIVTFRKFPQGDGLEDRLDFNKLKIVTHNGEAPINAPKGTVGLELIKLLEGNHRCILYGSALYMRKECPKMTRHLKDREGKGYLERIYAYDMSRTSRYRRNKKED
jgi:hypothetical protein